jgi:aspartyl-tRNA(Asn)/glutamyl-tRNA(Gln) amidotransferase subunit B
LEEDTAKSTHQADGSTLVDFNRSGAPLVEIVSRPDMRTGEDAKLFLQQIQALARAVHASDADLEKGQMRCDVNISIRPEGDSKLYTKIEVKNINSMRSVERAIQFEINRQSSLWEAGTPPAQLETRGWNDAKGETVAQRVKEQAADYRYFAEPDIPPLTVTPEQITHWQAQIPELPADRIDRFVQEYELSKHDAGVLVSDYRVADFYEEVISEMRAWLNSIESAEGDAEEVWNTNRRKLVRTTFGWITGDLFKAMNERGWTFEQMHITAENFAEFLVLMVEGKLNRTAAAQVLNTMLDKQDVPNGSDPSMIMQSLGVEQQNDTHTLSLEVDEVILANPEVVADIKKGKRNKLMFLVGQIMKKTKGTANPETITEMLNERLKPE